MEAQGPQAANAVPDAHDPTKRHAPMMSTADMALRMDPAYEKISRRFMAHPQDFADAFARAWFKLTHRDMGPRCPLPGPARSEGRADLAGPYSQSGSQTDWREGDEDPEGQNSASGLSISQLVTTAWASAATFRGSDKRGGANGDAFAWPRKRIGK